MENSGERLVFKVGMYLIVMYPLQYGWMAEIWFDIPAPGISNKEVFLTGDNEIELYYRAHKKVKELIPY